jgi:hypothetical protein
VRTCERAIIKDSVCQFDKLLQGGVLSEGVGDALRTGRTMVKYSSSTSNSTSSMVQLRYSDPRIR